MAELELGEAKFSRALTNALRYIPIEEFAREFEVHKTTVSRWSFGSAIPHIKIQRLVLCFIIEKMENLMGLFEDG